MRKRKSLMQQDESIYRIENYFEFVLIALLGNFNCFLKVLMMLIRFKMLKHSKLNSGK